MPLVLPNIHIRLFTDAAPGSRWPWLSKPMVALTVRAAPLSRCRVVCEHGLHGFAEQRRTDVGIARRALTHRCIEAAGQRRGLWLRAHSSLRADPVALTPQRAALRRYHAAADVRFRHRAARLQGLAVPAEVNPIAGRPRSIRFSQRSRQRSTRDVLLSVQPLDASTVTIACCLRIERVKHIHGTADAIFASSASDYVGLLSADNRLAAGALSRAIPRGRIIAPAQLPVARTASCYEQLTITNS